MILKYDEYFGPVLKVLAATGATSLSDIRTKVAEATGITFDDWEQVNEKGTNIFGSRIHWAVQYLYQAGALVRPTRGVYEISPLGNDFLQKYPQGFGEKVLSETEGIKAWTVRSLPGKGASKSVEIPSSGEAPQESIEASITNIENNVARELVSRIQKMTPHFLEKTVLELLGKMGYGNDENSLRHTGGPGDEGVDGIINQDHLGIQRIYVQAKRYRDGSNISGETFQAFLGAIEGATGGVLITTSNFTPAALELASKNRTQKIKLIDGVELGRLLVKYEVGAIARHTYKLMEIDENYFEDI